MKSELSQIDSFKIIFEKFYNNYIFTIKYHRNDTINQLYYEINKIYLISIGLKVILNNVDGKLNFSNIENTLKALNIENIEPPFIIFIYDFKNNSILIINDQYGLVPLYYTKTKNRFIYSTKLNPLVKRQGYSYEFDKKAILDFFTYGHLTGQKTFIKEAFLMPPGSWLLYKKGRITKGIYRNFFSVLSYYNKNNYDINPKHLFDLLSSSVSNRILNRNKVGVSLSGGLDSRAILGVLLKQRSDINTFTFGNENCRDVIIAKKISKEFGLKHRTVDLDGSYLLKWLKHGTFITSGMVSCDQYHILQLVDVIKNEIDVILDGLCGDAITGGHLSSNMFKSKSSVFAAELVYINRAVVTKSSEIRKSIFNKEFLNEMSYAPEDSIKEHFKKLNKKPIWWGCHLFDIFERQRRFIQFGPHQLRPFVDVQTPFYNNKLIDYMGSLPSYYLKNQNLYFKMYRNNLKELAKINDSARNLPIAYPDYIRYSKRVFDFTRRRLPEFVKRKITFDIESPFNYADWFRTSLRELVMDSIVGSNVLFDGIFEKKIIFNIIDEHMKFKKDNSPIIACLLTFSTWKESL